MLYFISKDVQEYMEQNHLESTDFEKAALIYNAGLPALERLELLEQLAEKTEDSCDLPAGMEEVLGTGKDMEGGYRGFC